MINEALSETIFDVEEISIRKEKISKTLHNYFESMSEEQRILVCGKGNRGRKQTQEEKDKRANSNRGQKHPTAGANISKALKGRKFSEEWLEKMSLARLGKKPENTGKCCINKEGVIKYVNKSELDTYINNGWRQGRK